MNKLQHAITFTPHSLSEKHLLDHADASSKAAAFEQFYFHENKTVKVIVSHDGKISEFNETSGRISAVLAAINNLLVIKEKRNRKMASSGQGMTYKFVPVDQIVRVCVFLHYVVIDHCDETGKIIRKTFAVKAQEFPKLFSNRLRMLQ